MMNQVYIRENEIKIIEDKMAKIKRYFNVDGYRIKNKYYNQPPHIQSLHKKSIESFFRNNNVKLNKNKVVYTSGQVMDYKIDGVHQ